MSDRAENHPDNNDIDWDQHFRDLVKSMRTAQKKYFQTRSPLWLETSKKYEKMVDMELKGRQQKELF